MTPAFAVGLRGRLLLLFLAALAVMLGMLAWHTLGQREKDIRAAKEKVALSAMHVAAEQRGIVRRADQLLLSLTRLPQWHGDRSPEECSRVLAQWEKTEALFFNIGFAKTNGDIECMAVPMRSAINVADRPYFQRALKTRELIIGGALVGRSTGTPAMVFARGLWDEAGQARGVLFVALDLSWLKRQLAETRLPAGSTLLVVDSRGTVLARYPDEGGWTAMSVAELPLFELMSAQGEGVAEESDPAGTRRVFAFTPLMDTIQGRVYLWIGIPKDVVTGPAERESATYIMISLTSLLAIFWVLWVSGRRWFLRPVSALSGAARRIDQGDLAARTGLDYADDELGQLARFFDDMAEGIQSREQQLDRVNHALRVLSAGNRALLGAKDEPSLIEDMCRAIVEAGGYRMAWVGYAEHDPEKNVRTVAAWGVERDFFDSLNITWDETESGRVPAGTAIRLGIRVASNDIKTDPAYAPWRERVQRHGVAASLALPLRVRGDVIGALCVCSTDPDAFDEEVVEILSETADDLAFGIANQRTQAEYVRTRSALATAEARFGAAARASIDALVIMKRVQGEDGEILDFEFTDLNPPAEQLLGMTRGQVIGQKLCELIPLSRSRGFFDKYVAVATTGTPLEEEFPIDIPQIKAKWLRQQVVRVDEGIAISSRDITVWKEAAAAMRRLQEQNALILNSAGNGICGVDVEGRATFINPAGAAMLQLTPEEFVGQFTHALHHHSKADGTPYPHDECPIYAAYRDGAVHRATDEVFWRKDGTSFPVEYVSTPIRDESGALVGAVVSFSDITRRKAAEAALDRAHRALRTLSAGNEALVRAASEEELLQSATRIIVEIGGYRMAGVGYVQDDAEKRIKPMAWAGMEEGYIAEGIQTWADTEAGQRPISRAIRSGKPELARDIASDPAFANWKDAAAQRGYASNLALPLADGAGIIGALCIYAREPNAFDAEETRLLTELANDLAYGIVTLRTRAERDRIAHAHAHHAEILQKTLEQSIHVIADTLEARDPYTAGHQRRVAELATAIARELGLTEDKIRGIHLAASIHDLGKINVPAEILAKPGKLTDIEFMLIKVHPQAGYDILKDVDFPWPIADMVRQHHEKLDGSGYPQGLKGGQILLESRIMTVADVVEAMASHRPYRAALGMDVALKEIERGRGSVYDPAVADACLKLFREGKFAFHA